MIRNQDDNNDKKSAKWDFQLVWDLQEPAKTGLQVLPSQTASFYYIQQRKPCLLLFQEAVVTLEIIVSPHFKIHCEACL